MIGFSLGSIIDTKKAELILKNEGLNAYDECLLKHSKKGTIFDPGPALGLFMALKKLNKEVPNKVANIQFALISKCNPNPTMSAVIHDSMKHYLSENLEDFDDFNIGFDMVMLTHGFDTMHCHEIADTDLMFTTSSESAKDLFSNGVAGISIPNISKEQNSNLYDRRKGGIVLITDYDGVVGDAESEKIFQKNMKSGIEKAILNFNKHEFENSSIPMELGPLGKVIKKISAIVKYQRTIDSKEVKKTKAAEKKKSFLDLIVVTARSGNSMDRYFRTVEKNDICVSQLYMMNGKNKNIALKAIGNMYEGQNILFFDDSVIHYSRSTDLGNILSGWVVNDENENKESPTDFDLSGEVILTES
jgi:hypothetical protein